MLRFLHISDTHLGPTRDYQVYGRNTYDYAQALVAHINTLDFRPDFILHTGDVTDLPSEAAASLAAEVFGRLELPIKYVVGNHDERGQMRQHLMHVPRSQKELYYDFQLGKFHFLVLDSRGEIDPQGYISEEQLTWLSRTCAASTAPSLVILLHHLPLYMGVPWYDAKMRVMNDDPFFTILRMHQKRIRGVFFGHIHTAFSGYREGLFFSAAPSSFMQFQISPAQQTFKPDLLQGGGYSQVYLTHQQTVVTTQMFAAHR
jgi:3',5'-cyclic-AMP phosphodiesterase